MKDIAHRAREASRILANAPREQKDAALTGMADLLKREEKQILKANQSDCERATADSLNPAIARRLNFGTEKIRSRIQSLHAIADLSDPVGQYLHADQRPNGLKVFKVRVPLGVILMIYEARPHVTVNAGAFTLKSGNAAILRGGSEAKECNRILGTLWQEALEKAELPGDVIQVITSGHEEVSQLLSFEDDIDLVIPRGSKPMIESIASQSRIPVLKHSDGICHVYIDAGAPPEQANAIVVDSKCVMPEVCNALETVLIHKDWSTHIPALVSMLERKGVEVRGCETTRACAPSVIPAADEDWDTEYLDMIVSIRTVKSIDQAIDHIQTHGSHHTDSIVTSDWAAARHFETQVDSSVVPLNASTMFCDGFTLGLGAEIGISTNKLHARGPMGLEELTSYKWVLHGDGHVYQPEPDDQ